MILGLIRHTARQAQDLTFRPASTDNLVNTGPCPGLSFTCTGNGIEVVDPRLEDFSLTILCGACRHHGEALSVIEQVWS